MCDVPTKKVRGPNFSLNDRALLLNIVESYMEVIENKKTDAVWAKQKEAAWKDIACDFNEASCEATRTSQQLKIAYENFKRRAKKQAADDKADLYKTGGGTFKKRLDADGERLVSRLNSHFAPLSNPCDSDGQYQVFEDSIEDASNLEDSQETLLDISLPVLTQPSTSACDNYADAGEGSPILSPLSSANKDSVVKDTVPQIERGARTKMFSSRSYVSPGSVRPQKRKRLGDYTASKVDYNDLRCRLLVEKHEMEMEILRTNLQVAKVELEIKKSILNKENK